MADHRLDRQPVLERELVVALVMRRHPHHRAFAVAHQHVVRDPDRQRFARERMGDEKPGGHPLLLDLRELGLHRRTALALFDERGQLRVLFGARNCNGMLGRYRHEGCAQQGVGASGEHP